MDFSEATECKVLNLMLNFAFTSPGITLLASLFTSIVVIITELGWNSLVPLSKYIFVKGSSIFKSEFIGFSAKSG